MAHHHGFHTVRYHGPINSTKALIPLLTGKIIGSHHQMLIKLIYAVSRKMLRSDSDACFSHPPNICPGIFYDTVGIRTECSGIHHRISPILFDITHRPEIPVASHRGRFRCPYIPYMFCSDVVPRRSAGRRAGHIGTIRAGSIAAAVTVARNQKRYFSAFLIKFILFINLFCRFVFISASADMILLNQFPCFFAILRPIQHDKQLSYLLLHAHMA